MYRLIVLVCYLVCVLARNNCRSCRNEAWVTMAVMLPFAQIHRYLTQRGLSTIVKIRAVNLFLKCWKTAVGQEYPKTLNPRCTVVGQVHRTEFKASSLVEHAVINSLSRCHILTELLLCSSDLYHSNAYIFVGNEVEMNEQNMFELLNHQSQPFHRLVGKISPFYRHSHTIC